jgi:cytochrome b561
MQRPAHVETGALIGRDAAAAEAQGYSSVARTFHWLTAALVLTMVPIGIAMANFDLGGAVEDPLYHIHRSIGALVLVITASRLIYRLRNPAPPLPADMPAFQQLAALATHWGLYAFLIVQPIVGWIATSAYRAPVLFFWMFELPPIWREDRPFSEAMFVVHRGIGFFIAALICLHIGAALYHHFILRDRVLTRMVSG